jgi:hypothetical protein
MVGGSLWEILLKVALNTKIQLKLITSNLDIIENNIREILIRSNFIIFNTYISTLGKKLLKYAVKYQIYVKSQLKGR